MVSIEINSYLRKQREGGHFVPFFWANHYHSGVFFINNRMDILTFLSEVGVPIGSAVIMAFFIFLTLRYILESVVGQVTGLTNIISSLESRVRMMNNDMIKIDLLVSSALELKPDIDRIARAENFVEDEKIDVRRD